MQLRDPSATGQTVQTAQAQYSFDTISSDNTNQALLQLKQVTVAAGVGPSAAFVQSNVEGMVRLPNMTTRGDGSVVVLLTNLGRLILNGTDLRPATGDLADMSTLELYSAALAQTGVAQHGIHYCYHKNSTPSTN